MNNWKRVLALGLSWAMALSLAACGGLNAAPSGSPGPSAPASAGVDSSGAPDASPAISADLTQSPFEFAAGISPDAVLLTVNGTDVPADMFLYMLTVNCMNIQQYLPMMDQTLEDVAPTMLEETVALAASHVLIRQKAAELGCLPTDAQNKEIQDTLDATDLDYTARYWGLGADSAEYVLSINAYYGNVMEAVTQEPTEEELSDYLAEQKVYRVKHILLKTVDDSQQPLAEDVVAEKKAQAESLLAQLQGAADLNAKFDELMMAHSEDNPQNNPDGYVAGPDLKMVEPFENAALALKEGEMSGIVETQFGYHIILRLPLQDDARDEYRGQCRSAAFQDLLDQWRSEAEITRPDALSGLDVAAFYQRLGAYQQALMDSETPAESAPAESGGVG